MDGVNYDAGSSWQRMPEAQAQSDLTLLPDEILLKIFGNLGPHDLSQISLSNRGLSQIADDSELWKNFCMGFGFKGTDSDYKQRFRKGINETRLIGNGLGLDMASFSLGTIPEFRHFYDEILPPEVAKLRSLAKEVGINALSLTTYDEINEVQRRIIQKCSSALLDVSLSSRNIGCRLALNDIKKLYPKLENRMLLFIAARNGYTEIVDQLVQEGAGVKQADIAGKAPLYMAAENGHLDVVRYLIERGANVHDVDKNGNTPLVVAAENGHLDVVKYLIEHGADVNHSGVNGFSPLWKASFNGHLEVVEFLIEKGANVHHINKFNDSSLHGASHNGHAEIVKLLLKDKVKADLKNSLGNTPLRLALRNGHSNIAEMLREYLNRSYS